jgi:hypothetical protein
VRLDGSAGFAMQALFTEITVTEALLKSRKARK